MNKQEKQKLALKAIDKRWDFEDLKYGDDLYGKEHLVHEVWEYVEECEEIGIKAFKEKYNL